MNPNNVHHDDTTGLVTVTFPEVVIDIDPREAVTDITDALFDAGMESDDAADLALAIVRDWG